MLQESPSIEGLAQLLKGVAALPDVLKMIATLEAEVAGLRREIREKDTMLRAAISDGWLDAKAAMEYMSISAATFDKYRYETNVKIKGYKLDGKWLYKKPDLNNFVMLYEIKSSGLA
jgi:hypothetical protein